MSNVCRVFDQGTPLAVPAPVSGSLRIGAFSRRVGISAAVLRAWETRYGLVHAGPDDRRVPALRRRGGAACPPHAGADRARDGGGRVRPAGARRGRRTGRAAGPGRGVARAGRRRRATGARRAARGPEAGGGGRPQGAPAARRASRRAPALRAADGRDAAARARRRRGTTGSGPLALAGCGPGEHDTIELLVLALALRRRGWRLVYLGADTPVAVFASIAASLAPARIIVGFRDAERAQDFDPPFRATVVCGDPLAAAAGWRARPSGSCRISTSSRPMSCRRPRIACRSSWSATAPRSTVSTGSTTVRHAQRIRQVIADPALDADLVHERHSITGSSALTG